MEMEYRRLGRSGLKVSALSFGAWLTFGDRSKKDVNEKLMHMARDAGVNFFDNAEAYSAGEAETIMGEILEKSGWRRDSYLVSSKVFWGDDQKGPNQVGLSRKHVIEACHRAMKRLRVDYLDLYFCHRPDPETPIEETVLAMNHLIQQGKVLYWGTSKWSAQQIQEAQTVAKDYRLIGPSMEQPPYSLLNRWDVEVDYQNIFKSVGIGTTVWSPLASGLLTGKYNEGIPEGSRLAKVEWLRDYIEGEEGEHRLKQLREFKVVCDDLGQEMAKVALAWCLKNPNVSTVILGATKPEQLQQNLEALEVVPTLTDDVLKRLDEIFPKDGRLEG